MMTFKFFSKGSNEAIGTVKAFSKEEAIDFFSKLKNLSTEDFLKIYEVR